MKRKGARSHLTETEALQMAKEMEKEDAESVLQWAVDRFGDRISLSTSFQSAGMVLLDMLSRISPSTRIITLDTGRLPNETYELMDKVKERYGCNIEVHYPDPNELQEIVGAHGINMFYRSYSLRLMCCEIRKVRPLERALSDTDAWITGLLRFQGGSRIETSKVAIDETLQGLLKINPLADWDEDRVWGYLKANDVPYNALYDQGYSSIGCAPCTRAIEPGEDTRAGRWWWESGAPKECGIHLSPAMKTKSLKQVAVNPAETTT